MEMQSLRKSFNWSFQEADAKHAALSSQENCWKECSALYDDCYEQAREWIETKIN